MRERGVCDGVYLCGLRREKERLFYALSNFLEKTAGSIPHVLRAARYMMHWARRIAASWSGHRPICRRSCVRTRRWSFPCGICCKKRLLASRERLQQIGERQKVRDNLATLQKTMPQTTGYSFEGYRIEAYCGVVCAEVVMGTGIFQRMERKRF